MVLLGSYEVLAAQVKVLSELNFYLHSYFLAKRLNPSGLIENL